MRSVQDRASCPPLGLLILTALMMAGAARADIPPQNSHFLRRGITFDWGPFADRVTQRRAARAGDFIGPRDSTLTETLLRAPGAGSVDAARSVLLALLNPDLAPGPVPEGMEIWVPPDVVRQPGISDSLRPWYEAFTLPSRFQEAPKRIPAGSTPDVYYRWGTEIYLVPIQDAIRLFAPKDDSAVQGSEHERLVADQNDSALQKTRIETIPGVLHGEIDPPVAFASNADPTREVVAHWRLSGARGNSLVLELVGVDRLDGDGKPVNFNARRGDVMTPAFILAGVALLVFARMLRRKRPPTPIPS